MKCQPHSLLLSPVNEVPVSMSCQLTELFVRCHDEPERDINGFTQKCPKLQVSGLVIDLREDLGRAGLSWEIR